jgi:vacuolar-type H+-ATPase subunit H
LSVEAQSQVTSITLAQDQIGSVQTAQNITTKLSFPEAVTGVICGDLFDPASQRGTFVVQNTANSKDVFIKPVQKQSANSFSNMFVTTASGKTYSFKLYVATQDKAQIVVNVSDPKPQPVTTDPPPNANNSNKPSEGNPPTTTPCITETDLARRKDEIEQAAQRKADEIIRKAREDANKTVSEAESRSSDILRAANEKASKAGDERFKQTLMQGVQQMNVENTRASNKKIVVQLDSKMWVFDGKAYLHYTIQNVSSQDFSFGSVSLEAGQPKGTLQSVPIELTQQKAENTLASQESLAGVIAFDSKMISPKDRLELFIRDADNVEVVRIRIQ